MNLSFAHPCLLTLSLLSSLALSVSRAEATPISITQVKSQKTLTVEVLDIQEGKISFQTTSGKKYTVPLNSLTAESVEKAREVLATKKQAASNAFMAVNELVGHDLFAGDVLWNEKASTVAERLGWPEESSGDQSSSYRFYTPRNYKFLGAHPYCATLYGGEGQKVTHLSLVFANKGDYGSTVGSGEDHFTSNGGGEEMADSLEKAIKLDAESISKALTEVLGEGVKQYYGEKEDRRRVLRWDQGEHAFLLSEVDHEYTSLLVVPKENADLSGKVGFVKDSDLRKIVLENVVRKGNGDVIIENIPMVDQGPKGYCAPATFERAMRYMLVPADMYLLATAATTQEGTNTRLLASSAKRIVRSKARRIKDLDLDKDLKISKIKKYIDKGVPVLWQMRSLRPYNKIANTRTVKRETVSDLAEWKAEIEAEAKEHAPRFERMQQRHHICMIIGYNEGTQEIAVSDSWGPGYELRWVHVDLAKSVTSRGGFVIDL